ncbi:MAG: alpha/beta hydrolase [Caldilineaceae bacterium]
MKIIHHTFKTNGIHMHITEAGTGYPVLFLHGFPELWYSWRHQLPAVAAAGFHAVAPDLRGFGNTDAPSDIASYSMKNRVADVIGLLDVLQADQCVLVGHDWGANLAWACAQLAPERIASLFILSVPYKERGDEPPSTLIAQFAGNHFSFNSYFQKPGVAEAELERDPNELPAWLTEADLDEFARAYRRTGFRGPLNLYRTMDRDWYELPQLGVGKLMQPTVFMGGKVDPPVLFGQFDPMIAAVPKLRKVIFDKSAGHWLQQERAAEVNDELVGFLQRELKQGG